MAGICGGCEWWTQDSTGSEGGECVAPLPLWVLDAESRNKKRYTKRSTDAKDCDCFWTRLHPEE